MSPSSEEGRKLLHLIKMGYSEAEASVAMERCGLCYLIHICNIFLLMVGRMSKFHLDSIKDPRHFNCCIENGKLSYLSYVNGNQFCSTVEEC